MLDQNKENTLISVIMTAYNREQYIAEAIESVIASTYENWELIIVDDQSKDRTLEIAKSYEVTDSRIKVYINEVNLGDYPNRNKAASYAHGKYLKYVDSDDIIYPNCIEAMVDAMEKYPEAGIGFCNYWIVKDHPLPHLYSSKQAYEKHFLNGGFLTVGPTGCIYRRNFFLSLQGFNIQLGVASDYHFNLRAAQKKPVVCFQGDLFWYRIHPDQELIKRQNEYLFLNFDIHAEVLFTIMCPLDPKHQKMAQINLLFKYARIIWGQIFRFEFKNLFNYQTKFNLNLFPIIFCFLPSPIRFSIFKNANVNTWFKKN